MTSTMPTINLRISRRWARMLTMLGAEAVEVPGADGRMKEPGTLPLTPERVIEWVLEQIDMGVFMPDSDMRPVVRSLFDPEPAPYNRRRSPGEPAPWEALLVPSSKGGGGNAEGSILRFAGPRSLCADLVSDDNESIAVYRPTEPDDYGYCEDDVKTTGDVALAQATEEGLTRARKEHRYTVVYHLHESPSLRAWFLADRRAEKQSKPSPPLQESAIQDWTKIRERHAIRYPHGAEYGLPEFPNRDIRGDPFWR